MSVLGVVLMVLALMIAGSAMAMLLLMGAEQDRRRQEAHYRRMANRSDLNQKVRLLPLGPVLTNQQNGSE